MFEVTNHEYDIGLSMRYAYQNLPRNLLIRFVLKINHKEPMDFLNFDYRKEIIIFFMFEFNMALS